MPIGAPARRLAGALSGAVLAVGAFAAPAMANSHDHGHESHCEESHPVVQQLITDVQDSLANIYTDEATLIAKGFIPYFDAMARGYPPGGEGAGHWLNPEWIDDGEMLNAKRPESVLVDEWGNPMGIMFVADEEYPHGIPLYVDETTGVPCQPWHPHTDAPARFAWWYYETLYDGDAYNGEVEPDEETAAMFHVWAIPNDKGWNAHGYPEAQYREGPPDSTEDLPGMHLPQLPGGNP